MSEHESKKQPLSKNDLGNVSGGRKKKLPLTPREPKRPRDDEGGIGPLRPAN
ncbi:hypothetical protein Ljor_2306 [Legionella jordanis]|uniref:Uncharacterized protein n=1 Tax=Legionella jordanis TaxID=456 RepID=A0A0W0VD15_9GAMM|nr:hypothetical protein Ljor_2306 [Legionella jordanis]VEH13908.1 Uncharacterised protein [Legionella jordanis]